MDSDPVTISSNDLKGKISKKPITTARLLAKNWKTNIVVPTAEELSQKTWWIMIMCKINAVIWSGKVRKWMQWRNFLMNGTNLLATGMHITLT